MRFIAPSSVIEVATFSKRLYFCSGLTFEVIVDDSPSDLRRSLLHGLDVVCYRVQLFQASEVLQDFGVEEFYEVGYQVDEQNNLEVFVVVVRHECVWKELVIDEAKEVIGTEELVKEVESEADWKEEAQEIWGFKNLSANGR